MGTKSELITVGEAAAVLKVSPRQVRNLIASGSLKANKLGRDYAIQRSELAKVPKVRKPGRPPKAR